MFRNAYATPARFRNNAGAMTHKRPPRQKKVEVPHCPRCGTVMDEGDDSPVCLTCEELGDFWWDNEDWED